MRPSTAGAEDPAPHGGVRYNDWRLPNSRELESLIDYGRFDPAVDPALNVAPAGTWASTSFAGSPNQAWCINFFSGQLEPIPKGAHLQVIPVRGGP